MGEEINIDSIPLWGIIGPSAVGKSRSALALAKEVGGEIVSADSMQVYKFMDIGTAKPSLDDRRETPHHMIDVVKPDEIYNAARFAEEASEAIVKIHRRGRLPILAGGSGLYIRALIDGIFTGTDRNMEMRARLKEEAKEKGTSYLHQRLKKVDPEAAAKIHPHDLRRLVRALEVHGMTGRPISFLQKGTVPIQKYDLLLIGLFRERSDLYRRIDERVEAMFTQGLVEEVESLLHRGYGRELPSMQGLGYKEMIPFLEGKGSLEQAKGILKRNTRRFAKRQMTWFRREKRIKWLFLEQGMPKETIVDKLKEIGSEKS